MSDMRSDKVFIFAGRATENLARRVAEIYGIPLGNSTVFQYADGEFQPSYEETIRGGIVFIIHDMITTAGVDRVITMDLHADQIQGFFTLPVDHLYGSSLFMPYIREKFDIEDVMFASPDMGGSKRAGMYAKTLNNSFVICYKHRNKPNEIGEMRLIGDVKDKHVILLDDIIDTGSTICKAAGIIKQSGAKSVRAMITHPVLSGNAIEKVEASELEELVVTDTIPLKRESSKIHVLSCDWLLAEAIRRVVNYESLDNLYETTLHHKGVIKKLNE